MPLCAVVGEDATGALIGVVSTMDLMAWCASCDPGPEQVLALTPNIV